MKMAQEIVVNISKNDKPEEDTLDNVIRLFEDQGHWNRKHMHHPKTHAVIYEGEPCGHPGCLNHITHPCEGCGRKGGVITDDLED